MIVRKVELTVKLGIAKVNPIVAAKTKSGVTKLIPIVVARKGIDEIAFLILVLLIVSTFYG
jgi:hypothetical protein